MTQSPAISWSSEVAVHKLVQWNAKAAGQAAAALGVTADVKALRPAYRHKPCTTSYCKSKTLGERKYKI